MFTDPAYLWDDLCVYEIIIDSEKYYLIEKGDCQVMFSSRFKLTKILKYQDTLLLAHALAK